jgi:hypothetical protein
MTNLSVDELGLIIYWSIFDVFFIEWLPDSHHMTLVIVTKCKSFTCLVMKIFNAPTSTILCVCVIEDSKSCFHRTRGRHIIAASLEFYPRVQDAARSEEKKCYTALQEISGPEVDNQQIREAVHAESAVQSELIGVLTHLTNNMTQHRAVSLQAIAFKTFWEIHLELDCSYCDFLGL